MVSTVTGNLADLWEIEQIWQTKQADVGGGTELNRDSNNGYLIKFHNGGIVDEGKGSVLLDVDDPDFYCRHETDEMALHWAYKDTAYSIETEDGRPSLWVMVVY